MSNIIGKSPNQIPLNSDLGTAAYLDKSDLLLAKNAKTSMIDAVIDGNSADVFVYDTSLDSDGGAWRKRTENLSWYNEELNTDFRGSRREFPQVAVIVASSDKSETTIYDGDDPDLPMWMIFDNSSGSMLRSHGSNMCCRMLNAQLCVGLSGNDAGMMSINFLSDSGFRYESNVSHSNKGRYLGNIAERNNQKGFAGHLTYDTNLNLVNNTIGSLAMTVLPNAPVNPETGLRIPTIACGTSSGICIITDDGKTTDDGYNVSTFAVDFSEDHTLVHSRANFTNDRSYLTYYPHYLSPQWTSFQYRDATTPAIPNMNNPLVVGMGTNDIAAIGTASVSSKHYGLGLGKTYRPDHTRSLVAWIGNAHNTGWMCGDHRLATFCSTDLNVGRELVKNGFFTSNANEWSSGQNSTLSSSGAQLLITSTGGPYPSAKQDIPVKTGQKYLLTAQTRRGTTSHNVNIEYNDGSGWVQLAVNSTTNMNTYNSIIVPGSDSIDFRVTIFSTSVASGETAYADNISLKLMENNAIAGDDGHIGPVAYGNIDKREVAAGSDMKSVGNFSNNNYFEIPYTSELDLGTGEFNISYWIDFVPTSDYQAVYDRYAGSGARLYIGIDVSQQPYLYTANGSAATITAPTTTLMSQGWHKIDNVRDQDGYLRIYVDGEQVAMSTSTSALNMDSTGAVARIGTDNSASPSDPVSGRLSMLRVSAKSPTSEQIKIMYEEEKELFRPNAKATLYQPLSVPDQTSGSAIAYDRMTKLLHVGNAYGTSVFRKLRRIDNTTEPVSYALSAVNGFIAEN